MICIDLTTGTYNNLLPFSNCIYCGNSCNEFDAMQMHSMPFGSVTFVDKVESYHQTAITYTHISDEFEC